ncbi:hypothetical protein ABIA33_001421 [Streptacidiphilus sp. MAP12-16]|uniref:SAF domain-containing protein n=1 Tax=Streptacidiphilus sp. MAP12-16 TaxID=3156300 RepID=UPI0035127A48
MAVRTDGFGGVFAQRGEAAKNGAGDAGRSGGPGLRAGMTPARARRRRSSLMAWAAGGLVVVCVLGVQWRVSAAGERVHVLALARSVPAGKVLVAGDLTEVSLPLDSGVAALPVGEESRVVGRRVAEPLWAGAPLAAQALADPGPGAGWQVVPLSVKEGRYPPALAPGAEVVVYDGAGAASGPTGGSSATSAAPGAVSALVLGVSAGSATPGAEVVTVRCAVADAAVLAQAASPLVALASTEGR